MKRRRPGERALQELIDGAEQTYPRCMAAVKFDGLALRLIDNPCRDVRRMALSQNPKALEFIASPNADEIYMAMATAAKKVLREQQSTKEGRKMKHEIEIPGLPEGWRAVAYRCPKKGEWFMWNGGLAEATSQYETELHLIVEKIKPRRIVLEVTDEEPRRVEPGEYYFDDFGVIRASGKTSSKFKIWREVKEEE